jgi:RNA polymerase sigma-70 factor (ECF subfamily)
VVDALPPQRKRVYKLAKEQEMTYDQVAAEVGISKNVVKTHLKEAFKFVKARLKTLGTVMLVLGVGQFFR